MDTLSLIKVKILLIRRFLGKKSKLKGFLILIRLKIRNEGLKLPIVLDQVTYIGLFLEGRALE